MANPKAITASSPVLIPVKGSSVIATGVVAGAAVTVTPEPIEGFSDGTGAATVRPATCEGSSSKGGWWWLWGLGRSELAGERCESDTSSPGGTLT